MDKFSFVMPAELSKADDGEWRVRGLASTEKVDQQGEILIQKGVDLSPIDQNRGYLNFDHLPGPENLVGTLDSYQRSDKGIFVEGRLFKNHARAKALHEIMSSLGKSDTGRVGLSVEGRVLARDPKNPKIITKCQVSKVAITLNPVNTDTYASLIKSMSAAELDFDATEANAAVGNKADDAAVFTAAQVMQLVQKAMGLTMPDGVAPPTQLQGGDALSMESMEKPKKRKLKKMEKGMYKSLTYEILDKIQKLYPTYSRDTLWDILRERLTTKFPDL